MILKATIVLYFLILLVICMKVHGDLTYDSCNFSQLAENMDCPSLYSCHTGLWTMYLCNTNCSSDSTFVCNKNVENVSINVTFNWDKYIEWMDGRNYTYRMLCRKWWVAELNLEGYFLSDSHSENICSSMIGTWENRTFSATILSKLPEKNSDLSEIEKNLIIAMTVSGSLFAIVAIIYTFYRFKSIFQHINSKPNLMENRELPVAPSARELRPISIDWTQYMFESEPHVSDIVQTNEPLSPGNTVVPILTLSDSTHPCDNSLSYSVSTRETGVVNDQWPPSEPLTPSSCVYNA